MGIGAAEVMTMLLGWALAAAVVVSLLIAIYWIIRKAVTAGIRDAREDFDVDEDELE